MLLSLNENGVDEKKKSVIIWLKSKRGTDIVYKCKICNGDIKITNHMTLGTCEYCGSVQTLPKIDDDVRVALFNRGNHLRCNRVLDFEDNQWVVIYGCECMHHDGTSSFEYIKVAVD